MKFEPPGLSCELKQKDFLLLLTTDHVLTPPLHLSNFGRILAKANWVLENRAH
jgi:hypothetical protein